MPNFRTCTHTDDSGHTCQSAAAKGRDFCGYHLNYRGRLMRRAQYRARHQRFDIVLPPLDSLCSIQSALSQVAEALAADMIDPRRAQGLLKALRFAKENLRDGLKEAANWHATPYQSEDAAAYDNFESDYGLPEQLDLHLRPEVAFPPPPVEPPLSVILSEERSDESKDPFVSPQSSGLPARDYYAEAEAAMQCHPEDIELEQILKAEGHKAWEARANEHQRNNRRRLRRQFFRANYDRFAAEATRRNIQRAAEKLIQERLAADPAESTKKPPIGTAEFSLEEAKNTA